MGESLPHALLRRVVEETKNNPAAFTELVAAYLPLLIEYVSPMLQDRVSRMEFARFKYAFLTSWRSTFGDEIPPPDFEGVYDYEVLMSRLFQHVVSYRDRIPRVLRLWGIYPAVEVEYRIRLLLARVLFETVLDLLRAEGVVS